jgi:6-phospho-beta-glucosidase
MGLKLTMIGGASSYTPELFAGLLSPESRLLVDEVALLDLDTAGLELITRVSRGLLGEAGRSLRVTPTLSREEAIDGADFVILQIRVGGAQARIRDETLPMEFGMVGNESTGPGGFMCALRTVPVALDYALEVERWAPHARLLNLTNPAGIVTEALLKHSQVPTVGFCNIPINLTYDISRLLGVPPARVDIDYFGLNHLGWLRRAFVDGEDVLGELLAEASSREARLYVHGLVDELIDPEWLLLLGMVPNWYLRYFYYTDRVLEQDRQAAQTDGQKDILADEQLHRLYTQKGFVPEARAILAAKGGARYYEPLLQVMDAIVHDTGAVIVADVRNGGAFVDLPADACVEAPARFARNDARAMPFGSLPDEVRGLVQAVKAYEGLAVEAAISGDRGKAVTALVAHPLCGSYPKAAAFLERALVANRLHLPRFFGAPSFGTGASVGGAPSGRRRQSGVGG